MFQLLRAVAVTALLAVCSVGCATAPASAQYVEVPNTPRATVQGSTVGVWALYHELLGRDMILVAENRGGQWFGLGTIDIASMAAEIAARGGPVQVIEAHRAEINAIFRQRFAGPAPTDTVATTGPPDDQVNSALIVKFQITVDGAGVPSLVPK